jgi:hypothetical protein
MSYEAVDFFFENGANKETLRHLRNTIFDRSVLSKWSTYLPLVKRIFNASIHSVRGVTPAKIIYGEAIDLNRNILGREESNSIPKIYMNGWVDSLVKGQREIVDPVRINLEKQKEKHLARNEGREITEFEIGSYVLVEHVQSNLRRGPKSSSENLEQSVNSLTGFAPNVMLFGRNVDLNRDRVSTEKLVECPKYV